MPILFSRGNDIYKISVDGTIEQRLTSSPEPETAARWSPNGQKIVFQKTVVGIPQIRVMNQDGTNQILISEPTISSTQAWWSPNGQKILFVKTETNGTDQIWVMNADGGNKTRLTSNGFNDHIPQWSPDGGKIAFGRCNSAAMEICRFRRISTATAKRI
ncbi:MAG TPA: hypothetical protein VGB00_13295 [Pyrinomonadaceae bacterium]